MASIRPLLFSLVLPLVAAPLVACGGDDGGDGDGMVTGEHYHYVAKQIFTPSRAADPANFGVNVDGDAEGVVDNKLGTAITTIGAALMNPTVASGAVDTAVADGNIIFLADVQTADFAASSGAGFQLLQGENPTPAACTTPTDPTTCGKHLDGNGSFDVKAGSGGDVLAGAIVGGAFKAGPGDLTLQIALGASGAIDLDLHGARIEVNGLTADGTPSCANTDGGRANCLKIGGAVTESDFDTMVLPGIKMAVIDPLLTECVPAMANMGTRDRCGCDGSAKSVITLLDTPAASGNQNCMVEVNEIKNNGTLMPLLTADVTIDGQPSLSIGVMASLTTATFDNP